MRTFRIVTLAATLFAAGVAPGVACDYGDHRASTEQPVAAATPAAPTDTTAEIAEPAATVAAEVAGQPTRTADITTPAPAASKAN
ncbi:MAG: hypothetical protein SFW09_20185 [Hyphomicrobiaceae bacterium]|nr:hypothetical protein [Hyphomicrobiaceae bacterium]